MILNRFFYFVLGVILIFGILGFFALPASSSIPPTKAFSNIQIDTNWLNATTYRDFFHLVPGSGISITNGSNHQIIIAAVGGSGINNTISSIGHGNSIVSGQVLNDHQLKGIACGGSLSCSTNSTDLLISVSVGGGNATVLNDLGDVVLSGVASGHILQADSNNQFKNKLFKINNGTCAASKVQNGVNNQTGYPNCVTPTTTAREDTVGTWEVDRTWANIGSTLVDVYTTANSNGEGQRIDTTGKTTVTLNIMWTKIGAGTQKCQIVDIASSTNILIVFSNLANGQNTNASQTIPSGLLNTVKTYKPQCYSTTAGDDPVWLSGQVLLK